MIDRHGSLDVNPEPGRFSSGRRLNQSTGEDEAPAREWRPEPGAGMLIGVVALVVPLVLAFVALQRLLSGDGLSRLFWLLLACLAVGLIVGAAGLVRRLRSIRYWLADDALVVVARGLRLEIPYRDLLEITFRPRDVIEMTGYERFWPGFYDSQMVTSDGFWRSVATTPPHERVRIRTRSGDVVAISPQRPVLFMEALERYRHGLAPVETAAPVVGVDSRPISESSPFSSAKQARRSFKFPTPLVYREFIARIVRGDPVASRLLALSVLVLIAQVFMAAWKVDAVTRPLAVSWDSQGQPVWWVRPDGIWLIDGVWIYPLTAAAMVIVNAAVATLVATLGRQLETRLLLAASTVCALIILIAMIRTTGLT